MENAQRLSNRSFKTAIVDQGYRGSSRRVSQDVLIGGSKRKQTVTMRRWMKRRSSVEPVIGHLKSDHRLGRNYLKGKTGDHANAILSGCGFNMGKLIAAVFLCQFLAEILSMRVA